MIIKHDCREKGMEIAMVWDEYGISGRCTFVGGGVICKEKRSGIKTIYSLRLKTPGSDEPRALPSSSHPGMAE